MATPFDQARELIMKQSTSSEAEEKIKSLQQYSKDALQQQLDDYFTTAESLAYAGKVKEISIMLRVLEHFGDTSHDRMLLHYIAQAAANNALEELQNESHPHHIDIVTALSLISEAFDDADRINDTKQ